MLMGNSTRIADAECISIAVRWGGELASRADLQQATQVGDFSQQVQLQGGLMEGTGTDGPHN